MSPIRPRSRRRRCSQASGRFGAPPRICLRSRQEADPRISVQTYRRSDACSSRCSPPAAASTAMTCRTLSRRVIKTDPDWSRLPAETPSGIRRLLKRCVAKDPNERLHAIADARSRSTTRYARPTPPPPIRRAAYLEARSHRGGADRRHRRRRQSILFSGRQVDRFLGIWRIKKSSR